MNWLTWIFPAPAGMSAGWLAQINRPQDHIRQPGYLAAMKQIATNATKTDEELSREAERSCLFHPREDRVVRFWR